MFEPYRARTVFRLIYRIVFYYNRDSLTVRSVKLIEPSILTVRFLVFDREPYRTKRGTVIRLYLRTANRTATRTASL